MSRNKGGAHNISEKKKNISLSHQFFSMVENGQIDQCLQAVSKISLEEPDFKISESCLARLKNEFVMMGVSTVRNYAEKWINVILQEISGIRNHCLLLKQLIRSTDLLQNKHLQELLQKLVPQTYRHLCSTNQYAAAATIVEVMFYAIAIFAAYSDDSDRKALWDIWNGFLSVEGSSKLAHLNLCTVLVMISLDYDCKKHIELLLESELNDLEDDGDYLMSIKRQFFALLEVNMGAVLSRCSPVQSEHLLNALIIFHVENNDLNHLVRKVCSHSVLIHSCGSQILVYFFRCLLLNLSVVVSENLPQQKDVGKWIENCAKEILSVSTGSDKNQMDPCKQFMLPFFSNSFDISILDRKFTQMLRAVCGEVYSFNALTHSVRMAIFSSLIAIIPFIPSGNFDRTMECVLSMIRSETKLFRSSLNGCKEKVLKNFIDMLLSYGYTVDNSKVAQIVAKEFLIGCSDLQLLIKRCDAILKDSAQRPLLEERYYYLKTVCDVLCELHHKVKVFLHVYELAAPVECSNMLKMTIFQLALSLLLLVIEFRESKENKETEKKCATIEDEDIAEHVQTADKLCSKICKHPEKLIELGVKKEQLSQLLKTSVTWMISRGKLKRIMSWKYARNFELYDEAVINYVINCASVDMLESLLRSPLDTNYSTKKFAFYSILAKHENELKRKLLCTVLNDILEVVVDVSEIDCIKALCFLHHIFPIVGGSMYEMDYVSFTMGVLALNANSLASDLDALRSVVSVLLDCLRFGTHSVLNDQCSLYAKIFICAVRAVQKHAVDVTSKVNSQLIRHLSFGLAKIAHSMVTYERSFSRIAPLIISECLEDTKCTSLALFRIFSMCDRYGIALLTTNLPALQKTRFAHLCTQFTKIIKIVG